MMQRLITMRVTSGKYGQGGQILRRPPALAKHESMQQRLRNSSSSSAPHGGGIGGSAYEAYRQSLKWFFFKVLCFIVFYFAGSL